MVTRLSLLPVCTAATATIVNGASQLHNSVSVVQWLIHLRAACEHCMLVEHNHTQRGGRGCGRGGAGRPWAMQACNHHSLSPHPLINHILQQAVVQFSATSETVVLLYSSSHYCCALEIVLHTLPFVCITVITTQLQIVPSG